MLAYRIDRQKRIHEVLTGRGAELYGGRWNFPGVAAVYCASSRSLAILEMLVHMEKDQIPSDRIMVELGLPDDYIQTVEIDRLGKQWSAFPYHKDSQGVFGEFIDHRGEAFILAVPSAIVAEELNFIIDPKAANIGKVRVLNVEPLDLDRRFND